MGWWKKLAGRIEASTHNGCNLRNSEAIGTESAKDEKVISFTTSENNNKILNDMGFNRTKI